MWNIIFEKKSFSGKTAFYKLHFSVNPFVGLNYESLFYCNILFADGWLLYKFNTA